MIELSTALLNEHPDSTAASAYTDSREALDEAFNLRKFDQVHPPSEKIDYISLNAIDFSKFKEGDTQEALALRTELAHDLKSSLLKQGFFYIINHGIEPETFERLNSISQAIHEIPESEKINFRSGGLTSDEDVNSEGAESGAGFKPLKYWGMANGVRDNISFFNYVHLVQNGDHQKLPLVAAAYQNEVRNYFRYLHHNVLKKLTILCDIILELPKGTIYRRYFQVFQGDFANSGGGFGRLMHYFGQSSEQNKLTENTWLRGHSDSSAFTFIVSQPMVSLQVRSYETKSWNYVAHVPNALIVNVGDGIEFLTGGYFKSTIHRVVNPPKSQEGHVRQAIIYFCKLASTAIVDPESLDSPYLNRIGVRSQPEWERITYGKWDIEKGRLFGKSKVNDLSGDAPSAVYLYGRAAERWIPTLST